MKEEQCCAKCATIQYYFAEPSIFSWNWFAVVNFTTWKKFHLCVYSRFIYFYYIVNSLRLYNKEIKPPPLCSKKTESLWGARWGVGGCVLLPTKICSRVCIGSFCRFTAVSLHGFRKSAKESPTNHLWSWLELQGHPRACRASVSRGQTPPGVQEICDGNYAR